MHENIEELKQEIEELRKSNILIIVEGIKDKEAMEELGLKNIITLKEPLFEIVEEIASKAKECVILTDLDEEGKELYTKIKKSLEMFHVKVNDCFREFLFEKTDLRQIEGLVNYLKHQQDKEIKTKED